MKCTIFFDKLMSINKAVHFGTFCGYYLFIPRWSGTCLIILQE